MLNYIVYWSPTEFNYDGMRVITLSLPLTVQFKVNLIITTALAIDRYQVGFNGIRNYIRTVSIFTILSVQL
jgi:hypothetical protein